MNGGAKFILSTTLKIVGGLFIADGVAELIPEFAGLVKVFVGVMLIAVIVWFDLR